VRWGEDGHRIEAASLRGGVLAMDLATRCGWAFADAAAVRAWPSSQPFAHRSQSDANSGRVRSLIPPEARPPARFGTIITGKPGSTHGERSACLSDWLGAFQQAHGPGLIVIEQPMPAKFSRNLSATEIAIGLRMVVQAHCHRHGLPAIREVPIISAKAWFGSRLQKDKAPMMACARSLGWEVATDHEADALAILDLTLARAAVAAKIVPQIPATASVAERRAVRTGTRARPAGRGARA